MAQRQPDIEGQLREAIRKTPMSLNELAAACSVDKGILSRFVRGERTMTLTTAARVATILGVELQPRRPSRKRR